ncbi:MAG: hypothetical protein AABW50_04945 [Nanoarchaeota archaeon]
MAKKWKDWKGNRIVCKGSGGIYGLGFIGAAIYYIQQATGFWSGIIGILKALVWPAFIVYKLLGL